jgi:hypothetical protein
MGCIRPHSVEDLYSPRGSMDKRERRCACDEAELGKSRQARCQRDLAALKGAREPAIVCILAVHPFKQVHPVYRSEGGAACC